ncbi:zinc ribbon domain-containing protein [Methanobrevibacter sp.]|uniref:zinc ribbon domain-containing protein n=1 Tax=Methanobrevibacter sp. TaxID=66852 RepID=UPI00386DA563
MTDHCPKCGERLKENAVFCGNCGERVSKDYKKFFNKFTIIVIIVLVILAIFVSFSYISSQTQIVKVDNVQFELPSDYVNEPSRTDINYDQGVKSSSMGWSNDKYYIEIGVTRTPGEGVNSEKVAADLGGTPTKMFGYTGYYLEYENEGYAFIFGLRDEVCMVYVSDYEAFDDVGVIGAV